MSIAGAISVVAIVIALLSAVLAWRAARRSLRVTTYSGATELTLQIDRMFLEHPEIRPFFYDPRRPLAEASLGRDRSRVEAAAEYILDILECIWDHRHEYDDDDREAWKLYILEMIGKPGSGCVLRAKYEEWSADGWYPALDDAHRRLDEQVLRHMGSLWLVRRRRPRNETPRTVARVGAFRLVWASSRPTPDEGTEETAGESARGPVSRA